MDYYDELLRRRVDGIGDLQFTVTDLFEKEQWEQIPTDTRKAIGRRFKAKVDQGDFVGVNFLGRNTNNQAVYQKLVATESVESQLSDSEIQVLSQFAGLTARQSLSPNDVAEKQKITVELTLALLAGLEEKKFIGKIEGTADDEGQYLLLPLGQQYADDHNLLSDAQTNEFEKMSNIHESEMEDYRAAIKKYGLNDADFQIDEQIVPMQGGGIEPATGMLTITYIPSGVYKQYRTGHGSQWPYQFDRDLSEKTFDSAKLK